ncbi:hypothetical protein LX36DRAFT_398470 [Colletotrichum falcatum]|nr:hypothetical protein LX36DRAFT_398470 [Colletotrichum falcatum]
MLVTKESLDQIAVRSCLGREKGVFGLLLSLSLSLSLSLVFPCLGRGSSRFPAGCLYDLKGGTALASTAAPQSFSSGGGGFWLVDM